MNINDKLILDKDLCTVTEIVSAKKILVTSDRKILGKHRTYPLSLQRDGSWSYVVMGCATTYVAKFL